MTEQKQTETGKIVALRDRLVAEQRRLVLQAADVDALPPTGLLSRIAQLEGAVVAVAELIEEN